MRTNLVLGLALAGLGSGCSDVQSRFYLDTSDAPFVYDIGELPLLTYEEMTDPSFDYADAAGLHYGQLGAGDNPGIFGGATFQFRGTGERVCIVVDPEAMFWSKEMGTLSNSVQYKYEDIYEDDGDIDLSVGLTAYYTGSPGEEVGDFEAVYTDELGQAHSLEFNECTQPGYFGDPAHAGRATVEWCNIDTSLREGVMYTVLLETFSLPIDDSVLNFGALAYDGPCQNGVDDEGNEIPGVPWIDEGVITTGPSECVIPNEVGNADPNGLSEEKSWFPDLEASFCGGKAKVNSWCKDNPGAGCQEEEDYVLE